MKLFVQEILGLNIFAQDYHLDDDVWAINDSDSDILETVEIADFVEFLGDNSSTLAGFEEVKYTGNLHIAPEIKYRRETAERNLVFLLGQINKLAW